MITDAEMGGPPKFKAPFKNPVTLDQIAGVRSCIGHDLYSGVGASAIIIREDERILMLQHAGELFWRPPAGFCDLGENVAQTAVREVQEETGYQIWPERILAIHSTPKLNVTYPNGDKIRMVGVVFRARLSGGAPEIDNVEILQMAWMTREEAIKNIDATRRWFYLKLFEHIDEGYYIC
jgi:ADP-ribose pyrophosphatase YjhB (NUDIX family)